MTTSPEWTTEQATAAELQGWGIFDSGTHGTTLCRVDTPDLEDAVTLANDDDAWSLVGGAEIEGDPLATAAMAFIAHHNPSEAAKIREFAAKAGDVEDDDGPTGSFFFMVPVFVRLDGGLVVSVTVLDETSPTMGNTIARHPDTGNLTSGNSTLCEDSSSGNNDADRLHLASLIDAANDCQDWPSWEFGF